MADDKVIESAQPGENPWLYTPAEGYWDEAFLASGFPRRHWRELFAEVGRLGLHQLGRRWQSGRQLIQAHGITYNVVNRREGIEHSWPMDPIPLVISEKEWVGIKRAVGQRANLLNAILADLYGPQRLLHERKLPAALVLANPNFLRSCFGIDPPGGVYLHSYATDIARSPDGTWWVVADRTQAPSGMGYTLQNRMVSARTLPGAFNQRPVRQLARFFETKRATLLNLASAKRMNPTAVVLTPGPRNETYFEHSFLAGLWGFPLVEGADLTVLDRRVYLKTLGGLKQVDLIVRRMDDDYCDPLELRADSLLGVPGLVDAVRAGSVVIDNALGSGLVETAAHMAFLPGLCRELLGEDLLMPSVATWWCGQEKARSYVMEHLKDVVVKSTFPQPGRHPEFPEFFDSKRLADLVRRIEARPEEFVAQERVALSTVPVPTDTGFAPRHVMLRVYAAWNGSSYGVLPGGLTRVSTQDSSMVVSMQLGGESKDTWVLGSSEEPAALRRQLSLPMDSSTGKRDLPSRVAENLLWLGRYAERVESQVRFVRALLPSLSGEEDFGRAVSLETATRVLTGMELLPPETMLESLGQQHWQVQRWLNEMVFDPSQTSSLRGCLKEMRRTAWPLKERLSLDTWRVLQQLDTQFSAFVPPNADHRYLAGLELLDGVIVTLSAFSGLLMESTTRGFGWRFLEIGRRIERALQTAELLGSSLAAASVEVEPTLQLLLQIADSSITYRSRYPTALQTDLVLEVLLTDESNPRSVAFQLVRLLHQVDRLQELNEGAGVSAERPLTAAALAAIRGVHLAEVAVRDASGRFIALDELVRQLKSSLYTISDTLTATYLSHLKASRMTVSW